MVGPIKPITGQMIDIPVDRPAVMHKIVTVKDGEIVVPESHLVEITKTHVHVRAGGDGWGSTITAYPKIRDTENDRTVIAHMILIVGITIAVYLTIVNLSSWFIL